MARLSSRKLVLRCYGLPTQEGSWYGVCLELNLAAEAETPERLRKKLGKIIESYIRTVLDTDDKESVRELLCRRAPLKDYLMYYYISVLVFFNQLSGKFILFKQNVPPSLAKSCC